ncbi:MAG: shikimate dehydrogenase [Candidatus Omnitrophica bacterium]|nr:shikimate dehydrogenase [Candidatus Omnitrophota bacterium]MBU1924202.1 shikimate dehydrogenase [Candidatus Omnitrophota bacterium]
MSLKPKLYGLVGFPVKHSLSPCMHNAALVALKIKAKYKLFELQADRLHDFLKNLKKNNICGFNVTIPYKEKVLPYLNIKSLGVREIGAVNTVVVNKDGKLKGFNTDFIGFSRHLKALKVTPRKAAIIGAGGAAKAVCFALGKNKVEEICIYDIDAYKSLGLVSQFKDVFNQTKFSVVARIEELNLGNKSLLVNASPVGMHAGDPCLIEDGMLHKDLFVYDLIYNPVETKLLTKAKKAGAGFSNGLGMLLYQGALSFEHFTGKKAPVNIMQAALEKGVRKL